MDKLIMIKWNLFLDINFFIMSLESLWKDIIKNLDSDQKIHFFRQGWLKTRACPQNIIQNQNPVSKPKTTPKKTKQELKRTTRKRLDLHMGAEGHSHEPRALEHST